MNGWFDAHNHLQDARLGGDVDDLVESMRKAGIDACVTNSTDESDWETVAALAEAHAGFVYPAFGVHPWKAHQVTEGWQDRLQGYLEKFPQSSLGEVGLDQWVDEPVLNVQREVLVDQLKIACELDRPVTIHCLKAWQPWFEVLEEVRPTAFLMHSFGGSIEVAERLISMGAYFSFSGYFLHERKAKVVDVFRQLPKDRVLVETDAPDMLPPRDWVGVDLGDQNHPANLPTIAGELAVRLGMDRKGLADLTSANARRFYRLGP